MIDVDPGWFMIGVFSLIVIASALTILGLCAIARDLYRFIRDRRIK